MKRRGFLGALAAAVALPKLPEQETPTLTVFNPTSHPVGPHGLTDDGALGERFSCILPSGVVTFRKGMRIAIKPYSPSGLRR